MVHTDPARYFRSGQRSTRWPSRSSASHVAAPTSSSTHRCPGLAGRLRVHAKHRLVEEHLRHRLAKHLAARRAEGHHHLARPYRDRRIGRHARPPPGPNARRMVTPGVAARTPHRYRDAGTRHHWPGNRRIARRRGEHVAVAVGNAQERRLRLGRGDLQGRAGGRIGTPGRDRSATDLARRRHAGPRLPRIDLSAPLRRVVVRQ
jgi:hypothetical protein